MLRLYPETRQAVIGGNFVKLSPIETRIIQTLQANAGQFVKSADLAHKVYGTADKAFNNSLAAAVYSLREKIRIYGGRSYIKSKHKKGYMLEVEVH